MYVAYRSSSSKKNGPVRRLPLVARRARWSALSHGTHSGPALRPALAGERMQRRRCSSACTRSTSSEEARKEIPRHSKHRDNDGRDLFSILTKRDREKESDFMEEKRHHLGWRSIDDILSATHSTHTSSSFSLSRRRGSGGFGRERELFALDAGIRSDGSARSNHGCKGWDSSTRVEWRVA